MTHSKALGADNRQLAQLTAHRDTRSAEKYEKLDSNAIRAGLDRLRMKISQKGRADAALPIHAPTPLSAEGIREGVNPRSDLAATIQERAWTSPIQLVPGE